MSFGCPELLLFNTWHMSTPNSDGINDLFKVEGAEYENYILQIFDRWGHFIFDYEDPWEHSGWHRKRWSGPRRSVPLRTSLSR